MVPHAEINVFLITIRQALALAKAGHAEEGYVALLSGLRRAQGAEKVGQPWGGALVKRWQGALAGYGVRHNIGRA
jgi:hypothetical protein